MTRDTEGTGFGVEPLAYLRDLGVDEAAAIIGRHLDGYSGSWYERFADAESPDEFTASDLVAVSMLGVEIPAHVAIWILGPGQAMSRELLLEDTEQHRRLGG